MSPRFWEDPFWFWAFNTITVVVALTVGAVIAIIWLAGPPGPRSRKGKT